jgi:hypothetical protein
VKHIMVKVNKIAISSYKLYFSIFS